MANSDPGFPGNDDPSQADFPPFYTWQGDDTLDFHHRVSVPQYSFPPQEDNYILSSVASDSSSMVLSGTSGTAHSGSYDSYVPSLDRSFDTVTSLSSPGTTDPGFNYGLEQGESGVPELPTEGRLQCQYGFLGCNQARDSLEEWDMHCKSHCPRQTSTQECPFYGCSWSTTADTGEDAWGQRWIHISTRHSAAELVDSNKRPPGYLRDHLYIQGAIDIVGKKDLQQYGYLRSDAYIERSTPRREQRNRAAGSSSTNAVAGRRH